MKAWALSLHDVAPATWADCERLLDLVRPYGVPVTLLVTPHYHRGVAAGADAAFVAALRARVAGGDEIVLHGYTHLDDGPRPRSPAAWARRRWLTASEGEFAALVRADAAARIGAGVAMLTRVGLPPTGFVPPAWLLGDEARPAVAASGLRYTCTRDVLHVLPSFAPIAAPSLVWSARAAWRRAVSRHWNVRRLATLGAQPRVRAALHPAEARYPAVLDDWRRLLDALAVMRRGTLETRWLPAAAGAPATDAAVAA